MTADPNDFDGISFGEVEETQPDEQLRPDQNKHFAVAPVYNPSGRDLPIYVDIDALRDMETHALDDTSVELGGVMLGGQYVDDEGNPFVVVTDSLRAEHYESTKGSFKFTHQTWSEISRQREQFPDDLQMVGWYHTHPDWGVFLSGMDMFICDNFFNKALDVALVIDPCRQDRGMFMWIDGTSQRVRRTDGFYLIGSRFREQELLAFAHQLEEEIPMADPRFSSTPQVIQVGGGGSTPPWMFAAVMGMLGVQMTLLALLGWVLLAPAKKEDGDKQLTAIVKRLDAMESRRELAAETDAKLQVLDDIVEGLGSQGQRNPMTLLAETQAKLQQAQTDLRLSASASRNALAKQEALEETAEGMKKDINRLEERLSSVTKERDSLKKDAKKKAGKTAKGDEDDKEGDNTWLWGAVAAVGLFFAAAIGALWIKRADSNNDFGRESSFRPDAPSFSGESSDGGGAPDSPDPRVE